MMTVLQLVLEFTLFLSFNFMAALKFYLSSKQIYTLYYKIIVPAVIFVFLSCRPFVAITTLSTGFVGVEVTSVSWLEQLTVGV